jgi:hypothetical protein
VSVRNPTSPFESRFAGFGLVADGAGSSRLVYATVLALIVIGIALVVLAVVVYRRTRVDPDVLAPLERMGSRKWRKGDAESRRELLDAVRPAGATDAAWPGPDERPVDLPPPVIEPDGELPVESADADADADAEAHADADAHADDAADAADGDIPVAPAAVVPTDDVGDEVATEIGDVVVDLPTDAGAEPDDVAEGATADGAVTAADDGPSDPDAAATDGQVGPDSSDEVVEVAAVVADVPDAVPADDVVDTPVESVDDSVAGQ